jgi:hypothetical protein
MSTTYAIDEDLRPALRLLADSIARQTVPFEDLRREGLDPILIAQQISDAVSREDDCPDCYRGTVDAGPMEHDTGHVPGRCDAGCGYVA